MDQAMPTNHTGTPTNYRCSIPRHTPPNKAVEPTPYSLRFATASGRGSPLAFGLAYSTRGEKMAWFYSLHSSPNVWIIASGMTEHTLSTGADMTTRTQHLLDTFDLLSTEEQQAVACAILQRMREVDLPPLTDEELVLSADAVFLDLDCREADDA